MGITTAYFLREHGADVTVLESQSGPALGASYGNGGYHQSSLPDPWNAPGALKMFWKAWSASLAGRSDSSAFAVRTGSLPGLVKWGRQFLKNSSREIFLQQLLRNMALSSYTRQVVAELVSSESLEYSRITTGGLIVFRDEQSMAGYRSVAEFASEHGCRFEMLDREALLSTEPSLYEIANKLAGAVYFPDDSAGDPRAFCCQIAAIAANRGVLFEYDTPVSGLARRGGRIHVQTPVSGRDADAVVIAAGARSSMLAQAIGEYLPIAPAKGYSITVPMHGWDKRPKHVIADMGPHAGINPMGDYLRVAGTAEFAGLRPGVTAERTQYMIGLVRESFPSFATTIDAQAIDPWGGHRPLSADGIPMIGRTSVDGVYVNTGHGGLGFTQAPGSSRALADLIVGETPQLDLADYSVMRFRDNRG